MWAACPLTDDIAATPVDRAKSSLSTSPSPAQLGLRDEFLSLAMLASPECYPPPLPLEVWGAEHRLCSLGVYCAVLLWPLL